MKKVIKFLGSLEFTAILMLVMAIWFAIGGILGVSSQYGSAVRLLNDQLVVKSLSGITIPSAPSWSPLFSMANIEANRLIKISLLPTAGETISHWLWGTVVILLFVGINLILATKNWLIEILKGKFVYRRILLFLMHFLFGIVLLAHFISAVSGFKSTAFPLSPGLHADLSDGYALTIDRISPESSGRQSEEHGSKWYSTDEFRFRKNKVFFTVLKDDASVFKGSMSDFEPAYFHGFQFTLTPFSFRSQVSHDFLAQGVGQGITISKNPGTAIMMIFQPIWIIIVCLYVVTILIPMNRRPKLNKQGVL